MGECVVVIEKIKYGGGVNDKSRRNCNWAPIVTKVARNVTKGAYSNKSRSNCN